MEEESPHPETPLSKQRYSICKECVHFKKESKICSKCNCFMPLKVRIPKWLHDDIHCPIGKW